MPPPTAIEVGDLVNVSLAGNRPRVLIQYEVRKLPTNVSPYWEFMNNDETVALTQPVAVTKTGTP